MVVDSSSLDVSSLIPYLDCISVCVQLSCYAVLLTLGTFLGYLLGGGFNN